VQPATDTLRWSTSGSSAAWLIVVAAHLLFCAQVLALPRALDLERALSKADLKLIQQELGVANGGKLAFTTWKEWWKKTARSKSAGCVGRP
jgi:uncharacterized membrane protein